MVNDETPPDFVMCFGDDRYDKDMFENILSTTSGLSLSVAPEIFACIIDRKVSKAKYYLNNSVDVVILLQGLVIDSSSKFGGFSTLTILKRIKIKWPF
ncbi:hypothetical protein QYF36_003678 [Acer negundo]|nr:hypothetical protein QYF36_003678 [Acer negundo]